MIGTLPQNNCRKKRQKKRKFLKEQIVIIIWVRCAPFLTTQSMRFRKDGQMDDFPQINSILRQLCRHSITLLRFFGKTALSRFYLTSRYVDGCSRFFCVDSSNLTMRQERRESATPARLKGHNHFAHWITHVKLRITSLRTTSSKNRLSFFVKTRHCRKYKYSIQRTVLLRRIRLTYLPTSCGEDCLV